VRIALLLYGLVGYNNATYRALSDLGNDLLMVYRDNTAHQPFDADGFADYAHTAKPWTASPPAASELLSMLADFEPDVILMISWAGPEYRKVMRSYRGRALRVLGIDSIWRNTPKQWLGRATHRLYIDPLYDYVHVPGERSEWWARRLGFGGHQIIRGSYSCDVPLFDRGARNSRDLATSRRFLFIGRLVPHKSPEVLAAAYRLYREQVEDPWELTIAGTGPLATVFAGIDGVDLRGFQQPHEVAALMHTASCFVFPSHIENYGLVVHEAAVAGLPMIVSDGVGAVPHLLQDSFNGWTVPAGDPAELAAAMVRVTRLRPEELAAMSEGSRALGSRMSPQISALHLHRVLQRGIAQRS
jgi:glycosyltransferase involved in cell wall biosynthesis